MQRALIINAPSLDWTATSAQESRNVARRADAKRIAAINTARANLQRNVVADNVVNALSFAFMALSVVIVALAVVAVL